MGWFANSSGLSKMILLTALLVTGSVLSTTSFANAAAYTFTQIDVPFVGASDTTIFGINDRGEVVGSYRDAAFQSHGFFRDAAANFSSIDVPFLNASNTIVYGLNNQGEIVGSYNTGAFQNLHGFVLQQGQFHQIDVPFPSSSNTEAFGINEQGEIVGGYFLASMRGGSERGFLDSSGVFTSLQFPSAETTETNGINNTGQIVGDFSDANFNQHGFVLRDGVFQVIDVPSGTNGTVAFGVNDLGQIVGDYFTGEFIAGTHGFLLDAGVFNTIDVPFLGSFNTVVRGINNRGDLVGFFSDRQGEHGFIASLQTAVPEPPSVMVLGFAIVALLGLLGGSKLADARKT
jgi:probable HAF family extracellular repeat protein